MRLSALLALGKSDYLYSRLHWFWLAMAAPIGFAMVFLTPPFQVPDEWGHFLRAAQVSIGVLYGKKDPVTLLPGGSVPAAAVSLTHVQGFHAMVCHPEIKIDIVNSTKTHPSSIAWDNQTEFFSNKGTVIYPPTGYISTAIGIIIGRSLGWHVLASFFLARLLNCVSGLVMGFFAIRLATRGKLFLMAILAMPMTLFEFASLSQDTTLIGCAALGAALLGGMLDCPTAEGRVGWTTGGILLLFTLTAAGRPVYTPVLVTSVLMIALCRKDYIKSALWIGLVSLTAVITWSILASRLMVPLVDGVDAILQARGIIENPLRFIRIFAKTLQQDYTGYWVAFIGVLGWLELPLQASSYQVYKLLLGITVPFGIYFFLRDGRNSCLNFTLVLLGCIASVALIFIISFLSWTPAGLPRIEGIQGRYFIPIACFAMIAMKDGMVRSVIGRYASSVMTLFAVSTIYLVNIGSIFKIVERYYY